MKENNRNSDFLENEKCGICNSPGTRKINVSANFTNYDLIKSEYVCEKCYGFLKDPKMRRSSWIMYKSQIKFIKNDSILKSIINIDEFPNKIFCTTSFKKHGFFKTNWNYTTDKIHILFDDFCFISRVEEIKEIAKILNQFYLDNGFTKTEIKTGCYNIKKILNFGVFEFKKIEDKIKKMRHKLVFKFVLNFLRKE